VITVNGLNKSFKVAKRATGLRHAVKSLFKREYTTVEALRDISFSIAPGEIVGYIGPNGAGKSTTIKVMSGILVPDSGTVSIHGYTPWLERVPYVRHIGVVFGQRSQLWWDVPVMDSFELLRDIYKVPGAEYRANLGLLIETLDLADIVRMPVRQLSLGQRMRCEIAASLLHSPSILFLDEPTIGLDIVVKSEIRDFLKDMNREHGTTILLTTHDLQDIEALCSRVIMLDDGRIIYDGGLEELKQRWGTGREVLFQFGRATKLETLRQWTAGLAVEWSAENDLNAKVWIPLELNVSDVLGRVVGQADITDIKIIETNTDEIVRSIYQSGSAEKVEEAAGSLSDDAQEVSHV